MNTTKYELIDCFEETFSYIKKNIDDTTEYLNSIDYATCRNNYLAVSEKLNGLYFTLGFFMAKRSDIKEEEGIEE